MLLTNDDSLSYPVQQFTILHVRMIVLFVFNGGNGHERKCLHATTPLFLLMLSNNIPSWKIIHTNKLIIKFPNSTHEKDENKQLGGLTRIANGPQNYGGY
jgi:hypothetical protein